MALTEEEIQEAKKQLIEQIKHLPKEQREAAINQIESMSPEAIEEMIEQQHSQSQKIFRMIIEKQIPSVQIEENSSALAVLSTKSISEGHTLIIPKHPIEDIAKIPKEVHDLSEKISKKLISSLKAKSTSVIEEKSFGELIINVIPIYDKSLNLKSPRKDISIDDLEKLKIKINVEKIEKKPEKIKVKRKKEEKPLKLPRRIP